MGFPISATTDSMTDVGTLWMMRHAGCTARCALMASSDEWELRVVVDEVTRLAARCQRGHGAFALADEWKSRMLDEGWEQITPRSGGVK